MTPIIKVYNAVKNPKNGKYHKILPKVFISQIIKMILKRSNLFSYPKFTTFSFHLNFLKFVSV